MKHQADLVATVKANPGEGGRVLESVLLRHGPRF
jgi:hypothetical protein